LNVLDSGVFINVAVADAVHGAERSLMGSALVPGGGFLPDRQMSRELARIDRATLVAARQDAARLDRMAGTTKHAMFRAAEIGMQEEALARMTPNTAGYVHVAAVGGVLGLAAIVSDAARGF
jgi:hypothetical protein